jgi:phosphatidylethanolamine-binding protein (PEBP) family uncharacterized protein
MKPTMLFKIAAAALSFGLVLAGCGSSTDNTGTGGTSATGGTNGTGGTTGTGGTATGGTTGTGGTSATGGTTATGGITGTGGAAGAAGHGGGGAGGATGSGGSAGAAGHGSGGTAGGAGGAAGGGAGTSGTDFSLTSMHLADGAHFDSKYTCQESPPLSGKSVGGLGNGVNPDLEWANAPSGTMSFAITFLDTTLINAGMDQYGNHWAMWNIPATVATLPEATMTLSGNFANAKQSGTFLAPCAQSLMGGVDDQYAFTIYALASTSLGVTGGTGVAQARTALSNAIAAGQVLGMAVLHGHAGLMGK